MILRWIQHRSSSIASAAVLVASFSLLSRFIGFIRDRILAGAFGASDVLDIYFAAFRVPDFVFQLIVVGAISASFIPLFTKHEKHPERAWGMTNNILHFMALGFGLVLIALYFAAPWLTGLIAPGFDAVKQADVTMLTRIMLLAQWLLALSMVFGSVLQSMRSFFLYSLAPIFYNFGIIAGVVMLEPVMGISGLAWGVVVGAFIHLCIQLTGVLLSGYRYRPALRMDDDVRYFARHMMPRLLGLAVNQLNFLMMTVLASMLIAGSVTMLQFAYNINFLPIGVIAVSYAIAAYPVLCQLWNQKKREAFIDQFALAARQILFFAIPATAGFFLLRAQIVRVVVGAGAFDWEATIITAQTLGFFSLSFVAQSLIFLLVRGFFATGDTRSPLVIGFLSFIVNLAVAVPAAQYWGVMGLGLAYSIAVIVQMLGLWIWLRRKTGSLREKEVAQAAAKLLVAGFGCALVIQGVKVLVSSVTELDMFVAVLGQGLLAGLLGLGTYVLIAALLGSEEWEVIHAGLKAKLLRKAKPQEPVVTEMQ